MKPRLAAAGSVVLILAMIVIAFPNLRFEFHTRNATFGVVRVWDNAGHNRYLRLEGTSFKRLCSATLLTTCPVRFPSEPLATRLALFFFDSDDKCIYCCRITGHIDLRKLASELEIADRDGTVIDEDTFNRMFAANSDYAIALRRGSKQR